MSEWIQTARKIAPIINRISFAYSIITVPFYTLIVLALIHAQIKRAPVLTGSFFKLCITAGINDIVTLLNNYFGGVFPEWGWFTEVYLAVGTPCVYAFQIIAWGSIINQALSVSVLTTNRLSALLFPLQYHKLWHGFRLKLAMSIQMVPGYIFASFILFNDVELLRAEDGALIPKITHFEVYMACCTARIIFLLLNSLFLIVSYCYLFYAVRKRNKAQSEVIFVTRIQRTRNKNKCRRAEFRLFAMSSVIGILRLLHCIILVAMQLLYLLINSAYVLPWFSSALLFASIFSNPLKVLCSSVRAYLLWVCSDALRRYVLGVLKFKRFVNSPVIIAH